MRPIPSAPLARPRPQMPAIWERDRGGAVPYVRNGQWYGHPPPNDVRYRLAHPFQNGQFSAVGPTHVYNAVRTDVGRHRVWLNGGFGFEVAPMDWGYTAPWCWDCDNFVVYPDPDHAGWYLIYDVTTGEYVHAEYLGT